MPRARICLTCGNDFGAAAPWREPHYAMLVCACPRCGQVHPAPRRRRAFARALRPWLSLAKNLALTILILSLTLAMTAVAEGHMGELGAGSDLLIAPNGPRLVAQNISKLDITPLEAIRGILLVLIARALGGLALGAWLAWRSITPRQLLTRSFWTWVFTLTLFIWMDFGDRLRYGVSMNWSAAAWECGALAWTLLLTWLFVPLGYHCRGLLRHFAAAARTRWLRKRLRRARQS